ncbi:flagellin N-terminal helical domain-containing protein [Glutamicibacter ardleyensis]|uniref:Flagellin n=1 Tax=Glutamicibacter ardleyensis TaxID=225894 RepID=A0ABQ2DUU7_9MICC|nr:flagellin [Glutamicibacter ardleyensis]GGJ69359.1 flagellin [Glutamicibacter ardleyensis]
MGMQINTNLAALNAHRNLSNTQNDLSKSLEKLSSGLRINRAADDAAGLSIAEGLRSQVNGMNVAARNAQDGISVIQTAEGALSEVHSILQRVRDLTVQAGNDSNNADSRTAIQTEITALGDELSRIATSTNFNGISLLDRADTATGTLTFQVGAGSVAADDQIGIDLSVANVSTVADAVLAIDVEQTTATDDATAATARLATIAAVDAEIKNISTARSDLGAVQNRFESTINTLNVTRENLQSAESRIRDVDMAAEMVNFTRSNILSQAGTAMLAQANQSNQGVLQLLG